MKCNSQISRDIFKQEYTFAGYYLIYQPSSGRILLLNETSHFICNQFEKQISKQSILSHYTEKYDITKSIATHHIEKCLAQWQIFNTPMDDEPIHIVNCSRKVATNKSEVTSTCFKHCFTFAGKCIQISLDDKRLEQQLLNTLGHLKETNRMKPETNIDIHHQHEHYHIDVNGYAGHTVFSRDEALAKVIYEMVESCYRQQQLAVLHAAAVAYKNSALVFVGGQGSGKSTLVAALQCYDFSYLADDVCPLIDNKLIPVPMSQVLKQGSWEPLDNYRTELRHRTLHQRLGQSVRYLPPINTCSDSWNKHWPIGALIFPDYQAKAELSCQTLDPLETLQRLMASGAIFQEQLAQILPWLEEIPAYRLRYSDLTQAVAGVHQICQSKATRNK